MSQLINRKPRQGVFVALFMLIVGACSTKVFSSDVGIEFDNMKTGTRLTTATVWEPQRTYIEEFTGEENGFFIMQTYRLKEDGSTEKRNMVGYDQQGRKVFSTLNGKKNTYTPYSCHYVVGSCTHTYTYYNVFKKKFVTNQGRFDNRLEGDQLIVGVIQSSGSRFEVPFRLGQYNLRLSNVHENALGKPSGFRFIGLSIPN